MVIFQWLGNVRNSGFFIVFLLKFCRYWDYNMVWRQSINSACTSNLSRYIKSSRISSLFPNLMPMNPVGININILLSLICWNFQFDEDDVDVGFILFIHQWISFVTCLLMWTQRYTGLVCVIRKLVHMIEFQLGFIF